MTKYRLRIECVLNKFLFYISYIPKIEHHQHDSSLIHKSHNISTIFFRRIRAVLCFITFLLNSTLDVPDLLSNISFHVPILIMLETILFFIFRPTPSYGHNHSLHRMLPFANSYLF